MISRDLELPLEFRLTCWPATLPPERFQAIEFGVPDAKIIFKNINCVSISTFIAFEISGQREGMSSRSRFVLNLPAYGIPDTRDAHVLRSILADKDRFIRYLLLILGEDGESTLPSIIQPTKNESLVWSEGWSWAAIPLLEELVRALSRSPEKIDRIEKLLSELKDEDYRGSIIPIEFDKIWKPVLEARKKQLK
jgi:hypothetical protein